MKRNCMLITTKVKKIDLSKVDAKQMQWECDGIANAYLNNTK